MHKCMRAHVYMFLCMYARVYEHLRHGRACVRTCVCACMLVCTFDDHPPQVLKLVSLALP